MKKILLKNKNIYAVVSNEDFELISSWKWHARTRPLYGSYAVRTTFRNGVQKIIRMHNIILPHEEGLFVDHINGNGLDNRRGNLRIVTHAENIQNLRKLSPATSKFRGVHRNLKGKWVAQIFINGKQKHIGYFLTEKEAVKAIKEIKK